LFYHRLAKVRTLTARNGKNAAEWLITGLDLFVDGFFERFVITRSAHRKYVVADFFHRRVSITHVFLPTQGHPLRPELHRAIAGSNARENRSPDSSTDDIEFAIDLAIISSGLVSYFSDNGFSPIVVSRRPIGA
jgi:hypothetical protein